MNIRDFSLTIGLPTLILITFNLQSFMQCFRCIIFHWTPFWFEFFFLFQFWSQIVCAIFLNGIHFQLCLPLYMYIPTIVINCQSLKRSLWLNFQVSANNFLYVFGPRGTTTNWIFLETNFNEAFILLKKIESCRQGYPI